jgi:hypothetical protein
MRKQKRRRARAKFQIVYYASLKKIISFMIYLSVSNKNNYLRANFTATTVFHACNGFPLLTEWLFRDKTTFR